MLQVALTRLIINSPVKGVTLVVRLVPTKRRTSNRERRKRNKLPYHIVCVHGRSSERKFEDIHSYVVTSSNVGCPENICTYRNCRRNAECPRA